MNDQRSVVFDQRLELMDGENVAETVVEMRHEVIETMVGLTGDRGTRAIGALMVVPCLSILVPLPLTNTVPGFGVSLVAVGLIERDGLFVIGGLVIGLAWVLLLAVGGPALIYYLVGLMAG